MSIKNLPIFWIMWAIVFFRSDSLINEFSRNMSNCFSSRCCILNLDFNKLLLKTKTFLKLTHSLTYRGSYNLLDKETQTLQNRKQTENCIH